MKVEDIKIGGKYFVNYIDRAEGHNYGCNYSGQVIVKSFNPKFYPVGTIEVICEDGGFGYFGAEDFVNYIESNSQFLNISTLDLVAELVRRKESGQKIEIFNEYN